MTICFILLMNGCTQGKIEEQTLENPFEEVARSKSFLELEIIWPYGLTVDPLANVFMLDVKTKKITKFDKNLQYAGSFGHEGQGPGEFIHPFSISVNPSGQIMITDAMNKITTYDRDGKLLGETKFPQTLKLDGSYCLAENLYLGRGLIGYDNYAMLFKLQEMEMVYKQKVPLHGFTIRERGELLTIEMPYLGGIIFMDDNDGHCVLGASYPYWFKLFDSKGSITASIERDDKRKELAQDEIHYISKTFNGPRLSVNDIQKTAEKHKYKNIIHNIRIDKGKIYVILVPTMISTDHKYPVHVYDYRGQFLQKALFPLSPGKIKNGYAYAIETAKDGETRYLVKFKLLI